MRIAYLVLAHRRPAQLARLISHLKCSGDVFVHLDRKAIDAFHGLEGCRVLPERLEVWWGGWSIVEAELALARASLPGGYDYYCLLSGQCFPIKPLHLFEARLQATASTEYMRYIPAASWPRCMIRFEKHHFERRTLVNRILNRLLLKAPYRRHLPAGLVPYNGWQWWTLTHAALSYVSDAFRTRPELTDYFRYTRNACELAFQTVIGNSPYHARVDSSATHEIEFPTLEAPHPRIWTSADLPRLMASPAFFARKFDERVDAEVLDKLGFLQCDKQ